MMLSRLIRSGRAQATVELAFAGIIFAMLILGGIDAGRAVWNYNTLAHAAREGTRYAIVHGATSTDPSGPGSPYFTEPDIDTKVAEVVTENASGLDTGRLVVEAEWPDGSNDVGAEVTVTARYTYEPIVDFLDIISFEMSSSSTMTITH
jgi:Flp pilus assembly protein TadG